MPGRFYLTSDLARITQFLGVSAEGLVADPPRHNVAPGEQILVAHDGYLQHMRWGLIPVGRVNARGRPVMETIINARSETVFDKSAFEGVQRCIVPADGWYEWTGQTRHKTVWRIYRKDYTMLAFAAIFDVWTAPGGAQIAQVATVTCEPSADVRDIHHRMGVILQPDQFGTWLGGTTKAAADLMRPFPDGMLTVEKATDFDLS
ncbi:SOS response-associated peptidase [Pseudaestuariivita rosea]|uniref:SOS response-associated peptidase n=1 Tax=Pseudaestuariivita rosea TaxID=2763263 RepID=UPI001ABAE8D4|nr:SOS response-associated peptidase [Pseudaestuariivita rosea]